MHIEVRKALLKVTSTLLKKGPKVPSSFSPEPTSAQGALGDPHCAFSARKLSLRLLSGFASWAVCVAQGPSLTWPLSLGDGNTSGPLTDRLFLGFHVAKT